MPSVTAGWVVHRSVGDAAVFHATDPTPSRSATFHRVEVPTLVLGSAQQTADVDSRVAQALGISTVRRRSGGGAVLLIPDEFVWLDLVIPTTDPLWVDDISRSMQWVGELWHRALGDVGIAATVVDAIVDRHDITQRWARQVCFAGLGAGEVQSGSGKSSGGRKQVGVSQRRTRSFARFQSLCHLQWRPELVAALVAAPRPTPAELAPLVACVATDARALCSALENQLTNS